MDALIQERRDNEPVSLTTDRRKANILVDLDLVIVDSGAARFGKLVYKLKEGQFSARSQKDSVRGEGN